MTETVWVVVAQDYTHLESVQGPFYSPAAAEFARSAVIPERQARVVEIPLAQIARERYREMLKTGERQDVAAFRRQMEAV